MSDVDEYKWKITVVPFFFVNTTRGIWYKRKMSQKDGYFLPPARSCTRNIANEWSKHSKGVKDKWKA